MATRSRLVVERRRNDAADQPPLGSGRTGGRRGLNWNDSIDLGFLQWRGALRFDRGVRNADSTKVILVGFRC